MAHGDARKEKWRGNWRMEWIASTLTLPRNVVYPALLTLMRTPRLPAVEWTDAPADLNRLVLFGERRSLVSARVPSHFKRTLFLQVADSWLFGIMECGVEQLSRKDYVWENTRPGNVQFSEKSVNIKLVHAVTSHEGSFRNASEWYSAGYWF